MPKKILMDSDRGNQILVSALPTKMSSQMSALVILLVTVHVVNCSGGKTTLDSPDSADKAEYLDYADYLDQLEAEWSTKQSEPCGDGEPLARMICLPWNYTREYRPENVTEVTFV